MQHDNSFCNDLMKSSVKDLQELQEFKLQQLNFAALHHDACSVLQVVLISILISIPCFVVFS